MSDGTKVSVANTELTTELNADSFGMTVHVFMHP